MKGGNNMRSIVYFLALSITMNFLACSKIGGGKDEAESTMSKVYELIQEEAYESVLDYYAPEFFAETPREEWTTILEQINGRLGGLVTYEVVGWDVEKKIGSNSGTYVQLTYKTNYTKYEAKENIILRRELGASDFMILGHHIASDGFL
jgi:hypothetical protein